MKASFLALSVLMISTVVHADLAELHSKKCDSPEVKALTGTSGSCRVVITPKKITNQGMCVGIFMGSLPCSTTYLATEEGAMMNLTCGEDPTKPIIDQDMEAEAMGYTVTTLIKKADGQNIVKTDTMDYVIISNRMVDINLLSPTTAEIGITIESGRTTLTDVTCQ